MRLIEQQRPGQFIRAPTEPPQAPQPAYPQPGRRRQRREVPAEPAPQPQLSEVLAAIQDLNQRMSAREAHDRWMAETQRMIMLRMHFDDIPPHPSGDDGAVIHDIPNEKELFQTSVGSPCPSICLDHRRVHCSASTPEYEIKDPFVRNYTCDTEHQAVYRPKRGNSFSFVLK
ncbi:hypothetical protein L2E82_51133 [Cichorium intybus]|nr:hypothetical protein L2E82_51133 [Cichorium intybus]